MARSAPITTGRKSVAPPIGAEPCLGPAWPKRARSCATEKSQAMPISWPPPMRMPLTRQITGLSGEDSRNHVVEQPHVAAIFLWIAGVIFSVFLGVAAGTECLVTGAGEDDRDHVTRGAGGAKSEDRRLHHVGCVGIKLARIVERDPCVVKAWDRIAIFAF